MWALVALFFGSLTVLMVAFTVIIIFWDDHRILGCGARDGELPAGDADVRAAGAVAI